MQTLYNILFTIFFVLSSPYYFMRMWRRGNWRRGFRERFGHHEPDLKQALTNRHIIWIHAVSVGEVNVCLQLIHGLEARLPNIKIVVSTTTTTGMAELRRRLPARVSKIYYPIDRRASVNRALGTISPEAIVLVESEIWPNFIWRAKRRRIPLFLVNARLSDRSYPRFKRFSFLFRPLFAAFVGVGAQDTVDAGRLREIGCNPDAIRVVGSLKFDAVKGLEKPTLDVPALLGQLGVPPDAMILVAGSTHEGEELLLAGMAQRLRRKFPKLFLVLVPRHFERSRSLGKKLREQNVKFAYRSELTADTRHGEGEIECLVVNTTGELRFFYEHADLVFIGKSVTAKGGQNPIEPCALGKATVFGPNMQNFAAISRVFLAADAAVQADSPGDLEKQIAALLGDKSRRDAIGQNAVAVVTANLGAVDRTVAMILEQLKDRGVYISPEPQTETGS